jgi:ornithine cyclodeaminase/alanine dehydrogenase-like protein (mu-crystallin family)
MGRKSPTQRPAARITFHRNHAGKPGGAPPDYTHCDRSNPWPKSNDPADHPVVVLYDAAEGELKGIIVGEITCAELPDNIAVTGLRTAATSAVGTDLLARPDATRLGLFGAAGQAKNHLLALMQVRKFKDVRVYSRNPENRRKFVEEMDGDILIIRLQVLKKPCVASTFWRQPPQRSGVRWQLA